MSNRSSGFAPCQCSQYRGSVAVQPTLYVKQNMGSVNLKLSQVPKTRTQPAELKSEQACCTASLRLYFLLIAGMMLSLLPTLGLLLGAKQHVKNYLSYTNLHDSSPLIHASHV